MRPECMYLSRTRAEGRLKSMIHFRASHFAATISDPIASNNKAIV